MNMPKLYRRRLIPDECILLDKDEILACEGDILVTRWETIRPKDKLKHGISAFFWEEGVKVSKFYDYDDALMYWYCDIITHEYCEEENSYKVIDLLVDVLVYPDGTVRVVDFDEMADALEQNCITKDLLEKALRQLDKLLKRIYSGEFLKWQKIVESFE